MSDPKCKSFEVVDWALEAISVEEEPGCYEQEDDL